MDQARVRPATAADIPTVLRFLERVKWITVECSFPEEERHIAQWPCWVLSRGEHVQGFLALDVRRFPAVQIHTVACEDHAAMRSDLTRLLEEARRYGCEKGSLPLVYVGSAPWLIDALRSSGFERVNRVVFLAKYDHAIPDRGNRQVLVRPARGEDIPALVALDEVAFEPIWRNSAPFFAETLSRSHVVVAVMEDSTVAYLCCTIYDGEGHLVRLAVAPRWQDKGIGTRLLAEAVAYFAQHGAREIILNTQEDNLRAQRLYRRFGFSPAWQPLTVLQESRRHLGKAPSTG